MLRYFFAVNEFVVYSCFIHLHILFHQVYLIRSSRKNFIANSFKDNLNTGRLTKSFVSRFSPDPCTVLTTMATVSHCVAFLAFFMAYRFCSTYGSILPWRNHIEKQMKDVESELKKLFTNVKTLSQGKKLSLLKVF